MNRLHNGIGSTFSTTNILDIPNEILIKIILHLNARERISLGNSCQRLHSLIFEDEELLKDLDFSKDGYLTTVSDIQQYFYNEITSRCIRRVNLRNVKCLRPPMLNTSVGKALNLVDIHIHGTAFKEIWQLATFLNPLKQVRRLSIDWPITEENNISFCHQVLQRSFGRLTYLSVNLDFYLVKTFLLCLQLCQELKELHMENEEYERPMTEEFGNEELQKLKNLEIVDWCGLHASDIKSRIVTMLPDPEKWTSFEHRRTLDFDESFYLEKNIEVCTELAEGTWMSGIPDDRWSDLNVGWVLFPERLLEAVIRITHENVPKKLCCLSTFLDEKRCLLSVADAKELVKNPKHKISGLYVGHDIERSCDVHLIACAFPSLTELYLCNITTNKQSNQNKPHLNRCLRKRGTVTPMEEGDSLNLDSSFKMLVDHTPHVKDLILEAGLVNAEECWDLDALYLIPSWKYLESLSFWRVPIEHGEFLVEVGKRCKNLKKIELFDLGGSSKAWCYKEDLFEMLRHCRNLRDFSIEQRDIGQVSEVLALLSNNPQLRRVCIKTGAIKDTIIDFTSSIEQLLLQCPKLARLIFQIVYTTSADYTELTSAVERLRGKFSGQNLQIRVTVYPSSGPLIREIGAVHEDTDTPRSYSLYENRTPSFP